MNWDSIDALSRSTMTFLLDSTVRGTIVLLAVGGAACFMRRAGASTRHKLWLVGIIATGLMPLLMLTPGWHVLPAVPAPIKSASVRQSMAQVDSIDAERERPVSSPPAREFVSAPPVVIHQPAIKQTAIRRPMLPLLIDVAAVIWAIGTAVMGGRLLLSRITLARLARRAAPASDELQSVMHAVASQISVTRRVRLLRSADASIMPMTWGIFRPTILLPASCESWTASRCRMVILHELSHTKRFDYAWILLAELIATVYGFNPLWRWALGKLRDEAEQSCDEAVLAAGEDRCTYADELVAVVTDHARNRRTTALAPGMSRCSTLESRVKLILTPGVRPRGRRVALLVSVGLVLIVAPLSQLRLSAQTATSAPAVITKEPASTQPASETVQFSGLLQDEQFKPLADVQLRTLWNVPGKLGVNEKTTKTDQQGRWMISANATWSCEAINLASPGFVRHSVTKPDMQTMRDGKLTITMIHAITVSGIVHDEKGNPVAGAAVIVPPVWGSVHRVSNPPTTVIDPPKIFTGADGKFSVDRVSPDGATISVVAAGFPPTVITTDPRRAMAPLDIVVSKGAGISGVVFGPGRKPIAGARVSARNWRVGRIIPRFSAEAVSAADGRFRLEGIPLAGDVQLNVSAPGLASTEFRATPRDLPLYEVQLVDYAKLHATVVDESTGKPIPAFRVVVSSVTERSKQFHFTDFSAKLVKSDAGQLDLTVNDRAYLSAEQEFRVRVSAPGYISADSQTFLAGGSISTTLALKPSASIDGNVVKTDGSAVANADVAWVRPDRQAFTTVNGTMDSYYNDSPDSVVKSDAAGHFQNLRQTSNTGKLVVMSPDGFAVQTPEEFSAGKKLVLTPWASLHGKFMRAQKPLINHGVMLESDDKTNPIKVYMSTVTSADGSYRFNRVLPSSQLTITLNEGNGKRDSGSVTLRPGHEGSFDSFRTE